MASTIYLVTSGCYSDYSYERAFSTRAAAEAWIGECVDDEDRGTGYRIEECALDDSTDRPVAGSRVARGSIYDGDQFQHEVLGERWRTGHHGQIRVWSGVNGPEMIMHFDHRDEERALKTFSEKRAQIIALNGELKPGAYDRDSCMRIGF